MAQQDYQPGLESGPIGPATRALAIAPSDAAPLPYIARQLWVGTAGDITLAPRDSKLPVLFKNVPVGLFPVWTRQVFATGTTASNIVALA